MSTKITFVAVNDNLNHYLLLTQWLNNQEVLQWWEGKTYSLKQTILKFRPRILNKEPLSFFIIYNKDKIGYIQYYHLTTTEKVNFLFLKSEIIIGIDLFIAEKKHHNQGLGAKIIINFICFIKKKEKIHKIIADPRVDNYRAIKYWEKSGFNKKNY